MSDQYVGEIRMFAGNYPPVGWAFCDGTTLPINGYEALYSLIGTTYGGDGQTNFKLPDLRGRLPVHMGKNPQTQTTYNLGQQGGTEKVTLTEGQLPQHTHMLNAQSAPGTLSNPSNAFWAKGSLKQYSTAEPDSAMNAAAISSEGGGQPHNNMMPFLTVSFIIATEGLYPSQG
ncbi:MULTISPECIES: phage tail protein [Paenibacillus]|uniref:Tail Collar domain-containing protein n=1 Tax=Paenibacillus cineris TaxID=237530 RepID=A0ABQ4LJH5_9BACL|nr:MULTISPECIES: tail fiber protein [Paenibacillus]UYO06645.1 tail fiber protein [Paenibacillus sp. PSB04]GIO56673.1 tail Collar domain-containing protein [Paenibacillus cineris]